MSNTSVERPLTRTAERWKIIRQAVKLATVMYELDSDGSYAKDEPGLPSVEFNPWEFENYLELSDQPNLQVSELDRYARLIVNEEKALLSLRIQPQLPMETIGGNDD